MALAVSASRRTSPKTLRAKPQSSARSSPAPILHDDCRRFLIENVSWQNYVQISDGVGERPIRVTFDGNEIELMSLSSPHEIWKEIIHELIRSLCVKLKMDLVSSGSFTIRREDIDRGFEPDSSYYIKSARLIDTRRAIDLRIDPPPDLAVEIEISRSLLDRLEICAAFGIPEVWRFDGERFIVLRLTKKKAYREATVSGCFPSLPLSELEQFIKDQEGVLLTDVIQAFQKWMRAKKIGPRRN